MKLFLIGIGILVGFEMEDNLVLSSNKIIFLLSKISIYTINYQLGGTNSVKVNIPKNILMNLEDN